MKSRAVRHWRQDKQLLKCEEAVMRANGRLSRGRLDSREANPRFPVKSLRKHTLHSTLGSPRLSPVTSRRGARSDHRRLSIDRVASRQRFHRRASRRSGHSHGILLVRLVQSRRSHARRITSLNRPLPIGVTLLSRYFRALRDEAGMTWREAGARLSPFVPVPGSRPTPPANLPLLAQRALQG